MQPISMRGPLNNPDSIVWEFDGEGRLNLKTGDMHYSAVRARSTVGDPDRRFFVGDGVWVNTTRNGRPPWSGIIGDLFLEAPSADDAQKGRVGVDKMRMTLRWMYSRDDVIDNALSASAANLSAHRAEVFYSDDWVHGENSVEIIEGRAWFADSEASLHMITSERPPADFVRGDRTYLARYSFYYTRTAEVVRKLMEGEIGDLSPPEHAPFLLNLLT